MTTDFPTAPSAYGLNGPSATVTVEKSIHASHTEILTPPLDLLSAVETDTQVHHALNTIAPLPRQLVALAFFKGLSHEEIATHTGLPLGTVKSQIRRALIKLKELLGGLSPMEVMTS